jgi:hypothetical protein
MITWTISNLDRRTADGFVYTVHWTCSGVDGELSSSVYNTCSFEGEPTTPYESLTQEQVLEWIWANGVDKDATETALAAQIETQKNPVNAAGVPW